MVATGLSEAIIVVNTVFLALSLVTVCLRVFVRTRIVKSFGLDDGFMVLAMFLNIGFAIAGIVGAYYGMGQKLRFFFPGHPEYFQKALLSWFVGQCFYVVTCIMCKISVILTLLRITVRRLHNIILYCAMGLSIIVGLVFFFFTIFQCTPVRYFWNRMDADAGRCMDTQVLVGIAYLYSAGAALSDFVIGLLPAFLIWNLHMTRRDKIAVAGILGIGCIAGAAVIVRIPFIKNYGDVEFLYKTVNISIFSNLEASLGIIAGSLTTLRPLIRFFRDASYGSRDYHRTAGSYPLSSTLGNSTAHPYKGDNDDATQLWPKDPENGFSGVRTTVLGSGRVTAAPVNNSSDEDLYPQHIMGSREVRIAHTYSPR